MTKNILVDKILDKPYTRRLVPDETGGYVASIFEFPGCIAEGDSAEEAIHNLDKAAHSWVEVALASNYEFREPISFEGCSGKIALRIPRGLHRQVAELAEIEGVSLNTYLVSAIAAHVGESRGLSKAAKEIAENVRAAIYIGARTATQFISSASGKSNYLPHHSWQKLPDTLYRPLLLQKEVPLMEGVNYE